VAVPQRDLTALFAMAVQRLCKLFPQHPPVASYQYRGS
jgi:hypothetical protein